MIILEDSEEAINGLARIIAQDPFFPIWIKQKQKELIGNGSMVKDEDYIKNQNNILTKAENIANSSTGYIFDINANRQYMIYKKINNEMIPLIKEFVKSNTCTLNFDGLSDFLKNSKLQNLITFENVQTKIFLCTHPVVRTREDWEEYYEYEKDFINYESYHNPASFNKAEINALEGMNIKFHKLNENDREEFIVGLKELYNLKLFHPLDD